MDGEDNPANFRVASFSCYLNTKEESVVLKLGNAIQDPASAAIFAEESPFPLSLSRTKSREEELNIFGADKYFNMNMDYDNTARLADHHQRKLRFVEEDHTELHHMKPKVRPGISTASSEASYNSQTALLPDPMRNQSRTKQKKAIAKRFFISFGCGGPCSNNKAAENGVIHGTKQSQPGPKRGEHFAFPILYSGNEDLAVKKDCEAVKIEQEPRRSLEVFGTGMMKNRDDVAAKLERKLSMLTWDAVPKSQSLPPTNFGTSLISDDMASDASSDLFEIENISGSGYNAVLTRQESDSMSGCMTPTTQYAPSEASVEWSVVTSSAADFSVASEYDGVSIGGDLVTKNANNYASKTKNSTGTEAQKIRSTGLLGCKSHKAVKVAEPAHKSSDKAKQQGLDSSFPFRKSQSEARVKDIENLRARHSTASRGRSP